MTELSQVKVPCDNWESGRTFWLQCRNCGFHRAAHKSAGEAMINGSIAGRLIKEVPPEEFETKLRRAEHDARMAMLLTPPGPVSATKIQIPEEKKVVAYNQRETTTKAHEYVLALPAAAGDVQAAIQHALTDKRSAGLPVQTMDAVMVRTVNDEELIVYWEEEVR